MNVLDCAIRMEKEAALYYQALAASADTGEKNLFTMLGAAEQEHHDALVQMREGSYLPKPRFQALEQAEFLFEPPLTAPEALARLQVDPQAYRLVMAQERQAVKLYRELAAQIGDRKMSEVLLTIADEERRHLSLVEQIYCFGAPRSLVAPVECA